MSDKNQLGEFFQCPFQAGQPGVVYNAVIRVGIGGCHVEQKWHLHLLQHGKQVIHLGVIKTDAGAELAQTDSAHLLIALDFFVGQVSSVGAKVTHPGKVFGVAPTQRVGVLRKKGRTAHAHVFRHGQQHAAGKAHVFVGGQPLGNQTFVIQHVGVDVDFLAKLHHSAYPFYGITSPGSRQCCGLRQRCA